ncbi:MAG: universal stress protein [Halohasta sp.]
MDRVLVPMDRSSHARAALREALELFPEAEIHVLHVLQITKPEGTATQSGDELAAETADEVLDAAVDIAAQYARSVRTTVLEGHAAKTILAYADQHDIDHIVVGSRGSSGLSRLLLGSVAESVARRSPCSVTIARPA